MEDKFRFDEKTHTYFIGGKPATGVTSIISVLAKPALISWAAKMAVEYIDSGIMTAYAMSIEPYSFQEWWDKTKQEAKSAHTKKKEAAGTHGTDAHALVEEYVNHCLTTRKGDPGPENGEIIRAEITPFIEWACQNVDHFLFSERRMFNEELFIAGTADFAYIGKDGKKYMADFKTSSGVYDISYWLQVAAYRFLAESEGDTPYDGSCVVRLGKKGDFEALYRYDHETDVKAFMACLTLYRAQATFKA